MHDRISGRYAVPQFGVQLPSGSQLVHEQTIKRLRI